MSLPSMPRVPAFQPRVDGEGKTVSGSRIDVLANGGVSPIYGDEERQGRGGQANSQANSGDAEDQLARLLAGADSGQIRAWAGNISQTNAKKAQEFYPNGSPLKYIGENAVPATYQALTLSEVNRRRFGAYVPWVDNQGNDMTPLGGNKIVVAGNPFRLAEGCIESDAEDAIPFEWQNQIDSEWRQCHINTGAAGGGSYNRSHLAMGRFNMDPNPHFSTSTLLS